MWTGDHRALAKQAVHPQGHPCLDAGARQHLFDRGRVLHLLEARPWNWNPMLPIPLASGKAPCATAWYGWQFDCEFDPGLEDARSPSLVGG